MAKKASRKSTKRTNTNSSDQMSASEEIDARIEELGDFATTRRTVQRQPPRQHDADD
jgi:hypothetical protein